MNRSIWRHTLFIVFFLILGGSSLLAQDTSGIVTGLVTDSSGGVVAGATAVLHRQDTNATRTAVTGADGHYTFNLVQPAVYDLSVSKPGFKTFQQKSLVITINQHADIEAVLSNGEVSEVVVVDAAPPTIQTDESSVGLVVDSKTIVNTPLNGRLGITGLIALAPGVQNAGSQDQIPIYGVTPSTGGASTYGSIGFMIDGATNTSVYLQRGYGEYPPLDGIQEFKTITTGAPAQYGQPTQITVLTRGGTNDYHGMLLYFNRNRFLAAKNYFATSLPLPKYNRNEFGGNFSGPIRIPGIYNGHDKSFFFFNYEKFSRRQASTVQSQMPTLKERAGDFSEFPTIYDPLTNAPFANNNIASRINPVSLRLQNLLYPMPNLAGTGSNLVENIPLAEDATRYSFRLDHQAGANDHFNATFVAALFGPNPSVGSTSRFGGMAQIGEHNFNTILGWTHTFSPSLLGQLTASYLHEPVYRTPQNYQTDFTQIIPGLPPQLFPGAPQITITNITSVAEQGSKDLDQTIQLSYLMTKSLQTHNIKFGVSVLRSNHWTGSALSPQRGGFSFTGNYTKGAGNTSGVAYADFLLGYPVTTSVSNPASSVVRYLQTQYAGFVMDDWKVTPKLTINVGLRYDFQYQQQNPYDLNSMYVPSLKQVVVFAKQLPAATLPSVTSVIPVVLSRNIGLPSNIWDYLGQDPNNIAPRFGFAYQIRPRTVVRGAFGLYYNMLPTLDTLYPLATNVPFYSVQTYTSDATTPTVSMSNPFPGSGSVSANPVANSMHSPVTPYQEQYNLAIEHQLSKGVGIRIGYVGLRNLKQNNYHGGGNVNQDLNAVVPAPGAIQPRRPIQPFSNIYYYDAPIFSSTMNSFQAGVHKQYSSGLTINAEYQWIRSLGNENFMDSLQTNDSYGNVGGLRPQQLVVSYSYELPFGKEHSLLHNAGPVVDRLVSGWTLSGISTFQAGAPFSVTSSAGPTGDVSSRANRVVGADLYPSKKTIAKWFNTAAFQRPAYYTYGNSAYNMMWGPGFQNWDVSLAKQTTIAYNLKLQLRFEAFNLANHAQFANPNAAITNAANFGTITSTNSSGAARTLQLGGKLTF